MTILPQNFCHSRELNFSFQVNIFCNKKVNYVWIITKLWIDHVKYSPSIHTEDGTFSINQRASIIATWSCEGWIFSWRLEADIKCYGYMEHFWNRNWILSIDIKIKTLVHKYPPSMKEIISVSHLSEEKILLLLTKFQ